MVKKTKALEKSLFIDTAGQVGRVCLGDDCVTWPAQGNAELVLEKIDKLLKRRGLIIQDIRTIKVNPGPGSFTGTRVGVAVANALNWGLKTGHLVKPIYAHPPHITLSK